MSSVKKDCLRLGKSALSGDRARQNESEREYESDEA